MNQFLMGSMGVMFFQVLQYQEFGNNFPKIKISQIYPWKEKKEKRKKNPKKSTKKSQCFGF